MKDLLYLQRSGDWTIVKGVPAEAPTWPATDNIGMLVCRLGITAYTFDPEKIDVAYLNNKGYTMKDIGKLETRIGKIIKNIGEEISKVIEINFKKLFFIHIKIKSQLNAGFFVFY